VLPCRICKHTRAYDFACEFDLFHWQSSDIGFYPGDVASRSRLACYQAKVNRVAESRADDRDRRGRLPLSNCFEGGYR
jgi:hypothetical protein